MRGLSVVAGIQRRVPWGVALTFDDWGPSLLDLLRELEVRATFFLTAEAVGADADLVRRMRSEGHGIGSRSSSLDANEIEAAVVQVQLALGKRSRLFRPPPIALDVRSALRLRRMRLDTWHWSVDDIDDVRERDVVRIEDPADAETVARAVDVIRGRDLDLVAL